MKRLIFFIALAMAFAITPLILFAAAATEPAIDPVAVKTLVEIILAIAATQPWGVWVVVGFAGLGLLATIARVVVTVTPGDKDDNWVTKYLGWIPTIVPAKLANRIVGWKSRDTKKLINDLENAKAKVEKLAKSMVVLVLVGTMFGLAVSGCPKKIPDPDAQPLTEIEKVQKYLEQSQEVVTALENELPVLYGVIKGICDAKRYKWCDDLDDIDADIGDGLAVANTAIERALSMLAAGNFENPGDVTTEVVKALADLARIYGRIIGIISRHDTE